MNNLNRLIRCFLLLAIAMTILAEPLCDASVNVSWENVTVPGIVSYTVYYRPTETMGGLSEQSVTVPSSESSVVIEDLKNNVEYQFQVAATAELGGDIYHGERSLPTTALLTYPLSSNPTPPPTTPSGKLHSWTPTTPCKSLA